MSASFALSVLPPELREMVYNLAIFHSYDAKTDLTVVRGSTLAALLLALPPAYRYEIASRTYPQSLIVFRDSLDIASLIEHATEKSISSITHVGLDNGSVTALMLTREDIERVSSLHGLRHFFVGMETDRDINKNTSDHLATSLVQVVSRSGRSASLLARLESLAFVDFAYEHRMRDVYDVVSGRVCWWHDGRMHGPSSRTNESISEEIQRRRNLGI
ncbi:hypothetical protein LTR97_001046 [Elasticomyces elasticus]|uniref:Uncharacterized protein n=1 Tax=Elasticomyces elasticus TaxID=574655 RepID=A0AAN7ZVR9_9PEZI|nr:hypothetical protein LTR97_001046 [Elasticomyces elasticus]